VVTVAPTDDALTRRLSIFMLAPSVTVGPQPGHEYVQVNVTLEAADAGHEALQLPLAAAPLVVTVASVMAPPRGDLTVRLPMTGVHVSGIRVRVAFKDQATLVNALDV
jgi:hypothetical protein